MTISLTNLGACCAVALVLTLLVSCGGGSSSGGSSGPVAGADFSVTLQPVNMVLAPGGTQAAQISVSGVNGFSGSVQITLTGTPSGVSVSPANLSLVAGGHQQITVSANSSVSPGSGSVSFGAVSGSLSHTAQLQLLIELPVSSPHPPFRTRYLRTDIQYNPNQLQFFPPHFTAYDSAHKRFFISNTTQNRIDVFDANAESQLSSIDVPLPWGLDVAADGSKLYVATTFGDVYLLDPAAMKVIQRFPSASLGSQGFTATQALLLADGRLALLGALGGFYLDGSPNFAIWDPVSNTLKAIFPQVFASFFGNIGQISLSADRTKVIVGSADSDGTLVLYDPSTDQGTKGQYTGGIICEILPTSDGKRLFVSSENGIFGVFDANTLANINSFKSSGTGSYSAALSRDGSTLYSVDLYGIVSAYDAFTFAQKGWVPSPNILDLQQSIVLSVVDDTGLIAGPVGHGMAFLDSTQIKPGVAPSIFSIGFLSPGTGPTRGGTALQAQVSTVNAPPPGPTITRGTIYIGNATANNVSVSTTSANGSSPPASSGVPADFTLMLPDGSFQLMPENFSYGPTIVEVSTNAASAEGGAQGAIFGYGLGQQPSDVQVGIGGQPANVVQVIPSVAPIFPYPFPMEAVLFTIPPGVAGTTSTVTVSTTNGSSSAANSFFYIPALQSYSLPGASLMQGIYDATRGLLYFTDRGQVNVFSPAMHSWLAPILISFTNTQSRLVGIALSPDANTLAVSDAGNNRIYVLNPSSPTSAKSFFVNTGIDVQPYGLAVTSSGAVYYATHDQNISPPGGFNKLDTATGKITNFELLKNGDSFVRALLSPDGKRVFVNEGGGQSGVWIINTSDNSFKEGIQVTLSGDGNEDEALSGDGTVLLASDMLTDENLNVFGDITYVDRDVWLPFAVYGQKISSDGSLIFQPRTDGIDIHDTASGLLRYRVQFPLQLANVYDALVLDNPDNLIFAITSTGIVQVDLHSLSLSLPPAAVLSRSAGTAVGTAGQTPPRAPMAGSRPSNRNALQHPHLRHLAPQFGSSPR